MASTASVNMLPARPGSRLDLPRIFLGGGVFGLSYNGIEYLESEGPAQTIRAAFRAGLTAVDTSPFVSCSLHPIGQPTHWSAPSTLPVKLCWGAS
jgi:hypothetical protein